MKVEGLRLLIVLMVSATLPLSSCGRDMEHSHYPHVRYENGPGIDTTAHHGDTTALKVLFIGNSLTVDATYYLPRLLALAGAENVTMYRAYHGGYTVSGYDTKYSNPNVCGLRYCKPGELIWRGNDALKQTLSQVVGLEEWDVVTIQGHTGDKEVWTWTDEEKAHINGLVAKIKAAHPGHKPLIGYIFSTIYAVGSDVLKDNFHNNPAEMYDACSSVASCVMRDCDVDFIIPTGTALQNLRTTILNINNGQDLSRDLIHADYGIGRYTTSCTTYKAVFENTLGKNAEDLAFRTDFKCYHNGVFNTPVTWANAPIALKCASAAIASPFSITDLSREPLGQHPYADVPVLKEPFVPAVFPVEFPIGYNGSAYIFSSATQASWRCEGLWICDSQPQVVAEFEWGPRYEGEKDSPFLQYANSEQRIGSPGFKGLWTGDFMEFRIPVEDLDAGTVIRMSFPLYGRQQPAFWDIEYFDEGIWKCNKSYKIAGSYGFDCTFVSNLYSTDVTHDMTFKGTIHNDYVRIRLKVAAGEYQNDTNSAQVVKRSMPYYSSGGYSSPVYFYGGDAVESISFSIVKK